MFIFIASITTLKKNLWLIFKCPRFSQYLSEVYFFFLLQLNNIITLSSEFSFLLFPVEYSVECKTNQPPALRITPQPQGLPPNPEDLRSFPRGGGSQLRGLPRLCVSMLSALQTLHVIVFLRVYHLDYLIYQLSVYKSNVADGQSNLIDQLL